MHKIISHPLPHEFEIGLYLNSRQSLCDTVSVMESSRITGMEVMITFVW
jgi:hypothetical protein